MESMESLFPVLESKFGVNRDARDKWGLTVVVSADNLHGLVEFLKNDSATQFDMLVDIAGIDYLGYRSALSEREHEGPRFAVKYNFKSMKNPGHRMSVKVLVSEDSLSVPTISDLFEIANWQEREVWDQYGIVFKGHPDLRRLLNHVEFVGHPLRKDYPQQKRQWLSTNDFLLPALEARLETLGYRVIERSKEVEPNPDEFLEGSIKE